jgi:putative OPT family oligopeptide transporter
VACAAAIAGDTLQDLKSGHLLGATPWKQQLIQLLGVMLAAAIVAPIMSLLIRAYGIAGAGDSLSAPQAVIMSSLVQGIFAGKLPWSMIAIGGGIAVAVVMVDRYLESRGSQFRMPVLSVGVGMYLPVSLSVPIFMGGLIASRARRSHEAGVLLSSGFITGEALMGIALAVPFALGYDLNFLQEPSLPVKFGIGVIGFLGFCRWLYGFGAKKSL